ncbi:MAG: hypothetical protein K6E34_01335 [Lachnospiraceae bacterium]|jgi:hypothetical protein|nr:hypothetical protein [Lachnospiraceae bacterium]
MDWDIDGFIAAIAGVFAVAAVIGIILYLIASIARYRYLRIRSYENAWMAFIPIVNIWAVVEATYGRRERINIYGWDAPATVLKLWPIVTYALALVINVIPMIGSVLSLILTVLNIAVLAMIFKDIMEQLDKPQETVTAVIVVIVHIVADIMILIETGKFNPGQQNWQTDNRVLGSQTTIGGPLSFLNGKI